MSSPSSQREPGAEETELSELASGPGNTQRRASAEPSEGAQTDPAPDPPPREILVVDDSWELLEWMKLDLEGRGFRVSTALSGEECVRWVELTRPPCVLLDVMMPGAPSLTKLLDEHKTLRAESTILLDESVYCLRERVHKPLYGILATLDTELPLLRDESSRLLVYQSSDQIYRVVSEPSFIEQHGEVYIHLDGYTTCQLITSCSQFKSVRVILFTAGGPGTRNERVQRAFQAGASDYLLKSEYYTHLFDRLKP